MADDSRPLSPHIQIWRWEISMVLSILHRVSGIALSVGTIFLAAWLVALAVGGDAFQRVHAWLESSVGAVGLFVYSAALYYHLCNGIRHLFWDAGLGFEIETSRRSAWVVVVVSLALTGLTWGLAMGGGA